MKMVKKVINKILYKCDSIWWLRIYNQFKSACNLFCEHIIENVSNLNMILLEWLRIYWIQLLTFLRNWIIVFLQTCLTKQIVNIEKKIDLDYQKISNFFVIW